MNSPPKLGKRLNEIFELIKQAQENALYHSIWDCCCDHGYLGINILNEHLCENLIFVDQLPHIINQLTDTLTRFYSNEADAEYKLIVADAGELNFDSQYRHLVVLAGVGGDVIIKIIDAIECNHPDVQVDYIFCPNSKQRVLREYLATQRFGLFSERLVCENKRYYEVIYIQGKTRENSRTGELLSVPASCKLWDQYNIDHQRYLKKINALRRSKKPLHKKKHRYTGRKNT
ncbi:hypothetical protein MNBD_GAMMA09-2037 [hydrothermal vent metagenome]|uniref:SAM-dependent methyltransferase n=1 Tax=hydrothermal vent metagenome TaxID=652676 RepID=A0A3B0Y5S0_9ZZZZ